MRQREYVRGGLKELERERERGGRERRREREREKLKPIEKRVEVDTEKVRKGEVEL